VGVGWVNVAGALNNTANADANFDLTGTLSTTSTPTLAQCLDGTTLTCRVYQYYMAIEEFEIVWSYGCQVYVYPTTTWSYGVPSPN